MYKPKKQGPELRSDAQNEAKELVDLLAVEQATAEVWRHFEQALSGLDDHSLRVLLPHLSGNSRAELPRNVHLNPAQFSTLIRHSKKDLIRQLKNHLKVRN